MNHSHPTGYQAPAVKKAFNLLTLVTESTKELGLSELAKALGFSKSTTHGLVQALLNAGALEQYPDRKKYCLGPAILELAFGTWNHIRVQELAQPYLDMLRDETGETVFIGSLSRHRVIIIAASESKKPLKISAQPGTTLPGMAGAVGKLYLSRFNDNDARNIIRHQSLKRFTPASITDEKTFLAELTRVRQDGYALDYEEYLPGVRAIAANINNRRGMPLAIWVVDFIESIECDDKLKIEKTLQTANRLCQVLDKSRR